MAALNNNSVNRINNCQVHINYKLNKTMTLESVYNVNVNSNVNVIYYNTDQT